MAKTDESAPFGTRFAVWQPITREIIFSEVELPHPRFTDSRLPCEKTEATATAENSFPRPFQNEDDVKRWRDGEVFPRPQEGQSVVRVTLPPDVAEAYKRIAEAQGVSIPEDWPRPCEPGRQPSIEDHLKARCVDFWEPHAILRKDFWPEYGPVRYRREYSGNPPHQPFREFFPEKDIKPLPRGPRDEKVMLQFLELRLDPDGDGHFAFPKCVLGSDWESEKLFAVADVRRAIEGRSLENLVHIFAFAAYEATERLNCLCPSLPSAAMADFCQSYDLWRHLCAFARAVKNYGERLEKRAQGHWEDETHRALLCIWGQLAEYASKMRLQATLEPVAPEGAAAVREPAVEIPAGAPAESSESEPLLAPEHGAGASAIRLSKTNLEIALRAGKRKEASKIWIAARKVQNLPATKAALYDEACQDKAEYYRWERGELKEGSQADIDIRKALLAAFK
jgi:hypothetical protein